MRIALYEERADSAHDGQHHKGAIRKRTLWLTSGRFLGKWPLYQISVQDWNATKKEQQIKRDGSIRRNLPLRYELSFFANFSSSSGRWVVFSTKQKFQFGGFTVNVTGTVRDADCVWLAEIAIRSFQKQFLGPALPWWFSPIKPVNLFASLTELKVCNYYGVVSVNSCVN